MSKAIELIVYYEPCLEPMIVPDIGWGILSELDEEILKLDYGFFEHLENDDGFYKLFAMKDERGKWCFLDCEPLPAPEEKLSDKFAELF